MSGQTITVNELRQKSEAGTVQLIDVRTPVEFQEVHVPFAVNMPLDQLQGTQLESLKQNPSGPLYVICRSGSRGRQACSKLETIGLNAVNVEGGTSAWEQAGYPVTRGRKVMSLERQVRIAAGTLVLVGAVLGYFAHPYWIGLSAFVGAGLVFAGVTDTCGMGMLLARMPWNQVRPSCATTQRPTAPATNATSKTCCNS